MTDKALLENPLSVNQSDIDRFWSDGFLVFDDIFSTAEIEELRAACQSPEDRQWETATATIHSLGITARHPAILNLARDERIMRRIVPLIGEDIQLQHSKLAAKPVAADVGPFGWHQDFSYFPHTNTSLVAVMVMLDDSTADNGCMSMVRGSHKMGLRDHMIGEYFSGSCVETGLWEDHPDLVIPITPRAGGISIHHCLTLHGSPANRSGKPRRGIVFQYRADDAFQLAGQVFDDTGLAVRGKRREHVRGEPISYRLPKFPGQDHHGFGSVWNQVGDFADRLNREAGV